MSSLQQGLLEWKPCGTEAAGPATAASSWMWLLGVLINNSFGERNYTLCFFQSWLSFFCVYLLGRTKNSDPTETCSLTVALDPSPVGSVSVCLVPGARGRREQSRETRVERVARPAGSTWCLPTAPTAGEPPVPTGVSHSQRAAFGDQSLNWPDVSSCQEGASGPRMPVEERRVQTRGRTRVGWGWLLFSWDPPSPHSEEEEGVVEEEQALEEGWQ